MAISSGTKPFTGAISSWNGQRRGGGVPLIHYYLVASASSVDLLILVFETFPCSFDHLTVFEDAL